MSLFQLAWWAAAAVTVVACLRWGDRPARIGAIALALSYVATLALNRLTYGNLSIGIAAIDAAFAVVLLGLSLRERRWWLLLATANQLLIVAAHIATFTDPTIMARADITSRWIFGVVVLCAAAMAPLETKAAALFEQRPA